MGSKKICSWNSPRKNIIFLLLYQLRLSLAVTSLQLSNTRQNFASLLVSTSILVRTLCCIVWHHYALSSAFTACGRTELLFKVPLLAYLLCCSCQQLSMVLIENRSIQLVGHCSWQVSCFITHFIANFLLFNLSLRCGICSSCNHHNTKLSSMFQIYFKV